MGFVTGRKIYENFTNGVGPHGLSGSAAMVNELAAEYHDEGQAVRRLTAKMESVWQGDAAGAARRGAGPLATEHELAAPHMAVAQDLGNRQAGSFVHARNAVVPVPPEPTAPDPWAAFTSPGAVATFRQQVAEYNAANQHNVDVMRGYTDASVYNTKQMPQSYGALTDDQAGIAVDFGTADASGPRGGGPAAEDASPRGGRGAIEWLPRDSARVAPPDTGGAPPNPNGAPADTGRSPVPQETTPGGVVPAPSGPPTPIPVSTVGLGSGPPPGGSGSGWVPGTGFVPIGGGPGDGSGGRGPGGRVGGGEPRGASGRLSAGPPPPGGVPGDPHAMGRGGGVAGRGGGMGGMPLAGGGRGRGEEDLERRSPSYLQQEDPEAVFGADELTTPPVIGVEFEPAESSGSEQRPASGSG